MSCFCYICSGSEQIETHVNFVESDFTKKSCIGNLHIQGYTLSFSNAYLGLRLNRYLTITDSNSTIIFPTWTIEDCLFIEVYLESRLIGLGKLYLATSVLSGPQEIRDVEWYTDITVDISIDLLFRPFTAKDPNAVAVFRKSLFDSSEKCGLILKIDSAEVDMKLKDFSLGFKEETWHQVAVTEKSSEIECVVRGTNNHTSLIMPKPNSVPLRVNIPTPNYEGTFLNFYVIPFFSQFIANPSTTVSFQLQASSNIWLSSFSQSTVMSIAMKSSMYSEGVVNEYSVNVLEIGDLLEFQFVSYTSEDKLVIKCLDNSELVSVGILKLKEIVNLEFGKAYPTNIQLGYNSCQFWITASSRSRDTNEFKVTGHEKSVAKTSKKLTYKDPVFLDVLELLEYKINKIKHKNLMSMTEINKINAKNELLKKRIYELERAPNVNEFKNSSAGKNATKTKIKTETAKKEKENFEGICGCGRPNPKFKGYCEECLKNIKSTYEKVYKWYGPIENKHKNLEDRFQNINGRKILLEGKVKRLEEKIVKPIDLETDTGIENTAELAAGLRKIEEEIANLEQECEDTANLYGKQQYGLEVELNEKNADSENKKKEIEKLSANITENENLINEANERMVFKQYFNEKYGNRFG